MDSLLRSFVKTSDYDVSFTEYAKYEMDNLTRIFKYTKGFWDKLYFRPHPNENVNDYKELQKLINCKIDNNYSFLKWISECKAVIAPVSSTCVEIALLKKPILNINDDTTSFFKVEKYDVAGEYFDNISTPLSKFSFDKLNDKKLLNKTVENELNIILDKYYNGGVTRYDIFKEALDNIKAKTLPYTIFKSFRILTELAMMTRNILIIIKGGKIAKDYSYTTFTKVTTKNDKAFDYCKNNNGIIKLK